MPVLALEEIGVKRSRYGEPLTPAKSQEAMREQRERIRDAYRVESPTEATGERDVNR